MKKIKYQGGITKLIASKIGARNKAKFSGFINGNNNLAGLVKSFGKIDGVDMDVVSFSSRYDFSEQVLSILSFIKNVGTPSSWTLYSDGSHTQEQVNLLQEAISFVSVILYDLSNSQNFTRDNVKQSLVPYFKQLIHYATHKPLGKKLLLYLNHRIDGTTLFTDSDILFYEKARILKNQLSNNVNGYFLPDSEWQNLDTRYMANHPEEMYQANSGFFIANKEFSKLDCGLQFLKSCNFEYEYFTEQTTLHALMKDNNFIPLDPRIFVLNSADQFDFSNLYPKSVMAIRHFTGPVRHKMWQQDWKWQLAL